MQKSGAPRRRGRRPAGTGRRRAGVTQEAVEGEHYWGQMFEMIVGDAKRLFALMEEQMSGVPGAKEAKAMMAMMPDLNRRRTWSTRCRA